MRTRLVSACVLVLALLLTAAPVAQAATYMGSGVMADAMWETYSEDGSSWAYTDVMGGLFRDFYREGPGIAPERMAGKIVAVYSSFQDIGDPEDPKDDVYREYMGIVEGGNALVSRKLQSAHLDEIVICDVNEWVGVEPWTPDGEPVEPTSSYQTAVSADLAWTSVGGMSRSTYKSSWSDQYGFGTDINHETNSNATVTGFVVDAEGNDLTFGADPFGSLRKSRGISRFTFVEPLPE